MNENSYDLSKFKRGDFYTLSNEIVSDQLIYEKDFSECEFKKIHFSNCKFVKTSFKCSKCEDLIFENSDFECVNFSKSDLDCFSFVNCKLNNINFCRSILIDFTFINCSLSDLVFTESDLSGFKFNNSYLQNISFAGTLLDDIKVKSSTLEKIKFDQAEVYQEIFINNKLTGNRVFLKNYFSFLKSILPIDKRKVEKFENYKLEIIDQLVWQDKNDYFNLLEQVLNNLNKGFILKEKYNATIQLAIELETQSVFLKPNYQSQGFSNFIKILISLFELYEISKIDLKVLRYWVQKILVEMKTHYL